MSVYLSVAPPDGFTRWGDVDWEGWLREHPWEAAARLCSRGDWTGLLSDMTKLLDSAVEPKRGIYFGNV